MLHKVKEGELTHLGINYYIYPKEEETWITTYEQGLKEEQLNLGKFKSNSLFRFIFVIPIWFPFWKNIFSFEKNIYINSLCVPVVVLYIRLRKNLLQFKNTRLVLYFRKHYKVFKERRLDICQHQKNLL